MLNYAEEFIVGYAKRGYFKKKLPKYSDEIYDLRLQCILISYSTILSNYNKTNYTALCHILGTPLTYLFNKKKCNKLKKQISCKLLKGEQEKYPEQEEKEKEQ